MNKNLKINLKIRSAIASVMIVFVMMSCSGNTEQAVNTGPQPDATSAPSEEAAAEVVEVDPMKDKGIGPVSSVEIGAIDKTVAQNGQVLFEGKCSACHKFDSKYVGPALKGVTQRRTPEWIMNMIMNPVEMTQKNPIAKQLLEEHLTQMAFQDVKQEEARAILEYFRSVDAQ